MRIIITFKQKIQDVNKQGFWKYKKYPALIGLLLCMSLINLLVILQDIYAAIYNINGSRLPASLLYISFSILLPIILFVWSTAYDVYNYWHRKTAFLYYLIMNISIIFASQIIRLFLPLITQLTFRIPVNSEITAGMIVNLTRAIVTIISLVPAATIFLLFHSVAGDKYNRQILLRLKAMKYVDLRKDKKYKYDFNVVTNLETGRMYTVKEKDRTLHGYADGTTGTAKTSSVLTVAICNDLDQKVFNENHQRRMCYQYLSQGLFETTNYFMDSSFSINYIRPMKKGRGDQDEKLQKLYNHLKYVSQTIGLTCVAPNAAFADEIYMMATARGFQVNRIDPILTEEGTQKEGFIGFNPLYISPSLTGVTRDVDITNKATIFADVLQCLYESSGSGDAYFISLNNSVTIAICKLLMLTFDRVHGRQPHPGDVQLCVNDFTLCEPYLKVLSELYGNNGAPMNQVQREIAEDRVRYDIQSQQRNVNCGLWQDVYTLIKNDLLGPNKENMFDRANGLRLQINNFLNHPLLRRVLCCSNSIDLDKALANGEITVVNYSLELGQSVSTAFGLFYLLSLSKAVLRRPGTEATRTLHMIYIDELSFLLHKSLEEFFTIFRQYKVGNFVAFQTLDQMDKNPTTKYLKGVLLGNCAHQIVFGRVSPSEMKIYESMGGRVITPIEQTSISQTSITSDSPQYSYSTRETEQLGNLIEGHEIRNRDFQEVTFFTVDDNSPVPPFAGKVHFLDARKRAGKPLQHHDWEPFMKEVPDTERIYHQTPSILEPSVRIRKACSTGTQPIFSAYGFNKNAPNETVQEQPDEYSQSRIEPLCTIKKQEPI